MSKFKIILKKGCPLCAKLTAWLKDKNVDYEGIDYLDPELKDSVMQDNDFVANYCDMSACVEDTPVIVKNDTEYYYGEIWDFSTETIIEEKAKEIFEV